LPLRAHSLLLSAWANAIGSGVAESARVIDTEIDKATVVGPTPSEEGLFFGQFYLLAQNFPSFLRGAFTTGKRNDAVSRNRLSDRAPAAVQRHQNKGIIAPVGG
jgi:hypothetical protein